MFTFFIGYDHWQKYEYGRKSTHLTIDSLARLQGSLKQFSVRHSPFLFSLPPKADCCIWSWLRSLCLTTRLIRLTTIKTYIVFIYHKAQRVWDGDVDSRSHTRERTATDDGHKSIHWRLNARPQVSCMRNKTNQQHIDRAQCVTEKKLKCPRNWNKTEIKLLKRFTAVLSFCSSVLFKMCDGWNKTLFNFVLYFNCTCTITEFAARCKTQWKR